MNFRFAVVGDAETLAGLRIRMRKERETVALAVDEKTFIENNIAYFRQALADGSYIGIIAEENGVPAGTGGICLHIHPPSYAVPNGKTACLLNMYTCPGFRGQGIAGKILATLVDKARREGCCKVFLNASDMGKPLYQKFGFSDVSNEMVFDLKSASAPVKQ